MLSTRPTVMKIDLDNYAHNLKEIRKLIGQDVKLMIVLKANASGFGAVELAKVAAETEADYFAVAFIDEGVELRRAGIYLPILVFGAIADREIERATDFNLSLTVTRIETASLISKIAFKKKKEVKIHIKLDTGMNRIGINPEDAFTFTNRICKLPNIIVEG
jgi:alanine racemase